MMLKTIKYPFALLLILCSFQLQANKHFQQLEKYTTEHGLPNNTILSIFQDSIGYLWFGTLNGLSRYNSQNYSNYQLTCNDSAPHPGTAIGYIGQLSRNELIVSTQQRGNYRFNLQTHEFQKLSFPKDVKPTVTSSCNIGGKFLLGTTKGLFEYQGDTIPPVKISDFSVTTLQCSPSGAILVGTQGEGFCEVDLNEGKIKLSEKCFPLQKDTIRNIAFLKDGTPFLLTTNGLYSLKNGITKKIISGNYSSLLISHQNEILLGTIGQFVKKVIQEKGAYRLEDYLTDGREYFNDYFDAQVNVMFSDRSGSIWIGTSRAGIDKIDRKKLTFKKYTSPLSGEITEAGYVNALFHTSDGKVWAGTSGKGLHVIDPCREKMEHVRILRPNGTTWENLNIESILEFQNKLYIGTRFHGIIVTNYPGPDSLELESTGHLTSVAAGLNETDYIYTLQRFGTDLYICSQKGTFRYSPSTQQMEQIGTIPSIHLELDSTKQKWLITRTLQLFHQGKNVIPNTEISDQVISRNGTIWLASSKGLITIQNGKVVPEFFNPQGKTIEFTSLQEDLQGQLWLGSRMGIYHFNPQSKIFSYYQIPGGSKANSFNHGKILSTNKGEIFWGSNDGVISMQPSPNQYLPTPLFDVILEEANGATQFHIFNLSYNHSHENAVSYRFTDPDSTWHTSNCNQCTLNFSHLKNGKYQIEITAINADGIVNEASRIFNFEIRKPSPFHLAWLFFLIPLLGGGIFLGFRMRQQPHSISNEEKPETTEEFETPEDQLYKAWMKDEFMANAIAVIEAHISDNDFSVHDLYQAVRMSKSNFYRKLKTITDLSPNELIRFIRLKQSTQLILEEKLSVNEIAYEIGFNTPSYYTRCFKHQFGVSPTEYKEHLETVMKEIQE